MKIILGSQSKGRKKVLEEMGIDFEVMPANIDEKAIRFKDPKKLVSVLARAKATALESKISEPALLITSDQVVVWKDRILEKPENEKEAREFLEGYNTYPAETITAVFVKNLATGKQGEGMDVAKVYFRPFSASEISELISDGHVFHWAGGFSIDGEKWEKHIEKIEGTRDSIMGLPKRMTKMLLEEIGNDFPDPSSESPRGDSDGSLLS